MTNEEINKYATLYRGTVINKMITLERTVDFYLAHYFSSNAAKEKELMLLIFGNERITFGNKVDILSHLCKSKSVDLSENYPTLLKDLRFLIEQRNILAHFVIIDDAISEHLPDGTIELMKLKNEGSRLHFNTEDFDLAVSKIEDLKKYIESSFGYHTS
ncbi:MAG: hypothetical protein V4687_06825 [Bacteroidota bacterium]